MRCEDQPWQVPNFGLVFFLTQRVTLHNFPRAQDVRELFVKIDNRFVRQAMTNADDKLFANPTRRVINVVELRDFRGRVLNAVEDFEKIKIFR